LCFASFALAAGFAAQAQADGLDINLNDDSGRITYLFSAGDAEVPISALYGNDQKTGRYWALSGGLQVAGDSFFGNTLMVGALGANAYAVDVEDFEILALGLGGRVGFYPNNSRFGFHFGGYYAPAFVTGLDGETFWDARLRADFKLFDQASIYIGYRELRAKLEASGQEITIDKGAHGGIDIKF
jgi:hypothetical protein